MVLVLLNLKKRIVIRLKNRKNIRALIAMNVEYHNYEPGKNWEEIQAQIYNAVLERMPYTVFHPISAERIKERYTFEKKDPQGVRYALDEEGKPLAYIQSTVDDKKVWIGYPWAIAECPKIVQETLYTDLLGYSKSKYPDKQIVMGYISESWIEVHEFAKDHGFQQCDAALFYGVDLDKVPKPSEGLEYSTKIATEEEMDALLDLVQSDPELRSAFKEMNQFRDYFTRRIFPSKMGILIFHEDKLVAASAPLQQFYKGIMFRFQGLRPGFEKYWEALAYEIAQICLKANWNFPLIFTSFGNWDFLKPKVEILGGKLIDKQLLHCLGTSKLEE